MPNIPIAIMFMLCCARIGAVHNVVYGGISAKELATRLDECDPKLVFTSSAGFEDTHHCDQHEGT